MSIRADDHRPTRDIAPTMQRNAESQSREQAMDFFASRFGIRSAFIRVKTLSRVLGIGGGTIYSAMRAGTFFIPHRMLGIAPAVKLEDLADWYCQCPDAVERAPGLSIPDAGCADPSESSAVDAESTVGKKERRRAIIEAALAEMQKVQ